MHNVEQQFKFTQPTICRNNLCSNRTKFELLLNKSRFVDFQKLRIEVQLIEETKNGLKNDPKLYDNMIASLFPFVYGSDEIKKGILLQLFHGAFRSTRDSICSSLCSTIATR